VCGRTRHPPRGSENAAPDTGADSEAVLESMGVDKQRIAALIESGAVGK